MDLLKAKHEQNNRIKEYYRIVDIGLKYHMLLLSLNEEIRYYDRYIKFLENENIKDSKIFIKI